jgi:hypothetical protein
LRLLLHACNSLKRINPDTAVSSTYAYVTGISCPSTGVLDQYLMDSILAETYKHHGIPIQYCACSQPLCLDHGGRDDLSDITGMTRSMGSDVGVTFLLVLNVRIILYISFISLKTRTFRRLSEAKPVVVTIPGDRYVYSFLLKHVLAYSISCQDLKEIHSFEN